MRKDLKELSIQVLKELTPEVYPIGKVTSFIKSILYKNFLYIAVKYENIGYSKAIEELSKKEKGAL